MTTYLKPAVGPAWAENAGPADLLNPGSTYTATGWVLGTKPPRQYMNWAQNYTFNAVRYFCQVGVVDWDAAETYGIGALVRGPDGLIYQGLTTGNINHTPASSPTQWGSPRVFTPAGNDSSTAVATTAFVANNYLRNTTTIGSLSGQVTNAQVPVGAVTQWQGSLAISFSQMTGTISNAQVPVGAVTQWQAFLGIGWSQLIGTKNADQLGGAVLGPSAGYSGNAVARYDSLGELYCSYLNQASANGENPTISQVMVTNGTDNFLRKASIAALGLALGGSQSLTTNGYARLPGGLILQWGVLPIGDIPGPDILGGVTYPIAFPHNVLAVLVTLEDSNASAYGASSVINTIAKTFTGFTYGIRELANFVQNASVVWFAIGF
jgi:hypothetical protein